MPIEYSTLSVTVPYEVEEKIKKIISKDSRLNNFYEDIVWALRRYSNYSEYCVPMDDRMFLWTTSSDFESFLPPLRILFEYDSENNEIILLDVEPR